MRTRTIPGPRGPFLIPAEPEATSMHAERCCRSVFEGEYSYPRASVEPVQTMIDAGANLGAFTLWASAWWPTLGNVMAIEPNADAADLYRKNTVAQAGPIIDLYVGAVTTADCPISLSDEDNWGARHIVLGYDRDRVPEVSKIRPYDLPPADVLKCDVEGVGAQVFMFYRHWAGVKVAMYESHHREEADMMADSCVRAGLHMVRGNPLNPECDVRVWVR